MQTVSLESHVGADGILHLHVPVLVRERNFEVLVVFQPVESNGHVGNGVSGEDSAWPAGFLDTVVGGWKGEPPVRPEQFSERKNEELDANGWPIGFAERTYGCLADDPIERPEQLDFEIREEIE